MSISWNSITDFSTASNPNGVWSYIGGTESAPYLLNVGHRTDWGSSIIGYVGPVGAPDDPYPIIALNQTDNTINPGDAVFLPPHSMHLHPAPNGDEAILRFTAPIAGTYAIQGFWERYDASTFGDGTWDSIYENGNHLLSTYLPPDSYGTEFPFDRTVSLSAGDTLDFVVNANGGYAYDTTGLGLTISNLTNTWTDASGNHQASDPANWSFGSAPQPGDTLLLPPGSRMDIENNDLQGNPLTIPYPPPYSDQPPVTLNLSKNAQVTLQGNSSYIPVTVNITGHDTLNVVEPPPTGRFTPVTVNLADHATLVGNFVMNATSLTINGGAEEPIRTLSRPQKTHDPSHAQQHDRARPGQRPGLLSRPDQAIRGALRRERGHRLELDPRGLSDTPRVRVGVVDVRLGSSDAA